MTNAMKKEDQEMPDDKNTRNRQLGAILAGLRLLQAWHLDEVTTKDAQMDVSIDDIETSSGEFDPMSADEIDALCERLNCEGITVGEVLTR